MYLHTHNCVCKFKEHPPEGTPGKSIYNMETPSFEIPIPKL
jgi:hypothetical protein